MNYFSIRSSHKKNRTFLSKNLLSSLRRHKRYYTYSDSHQYIPIRGVPNYVVTWEDTENNSNIEVNVTILKSEAAFRQFLKEAQQSEWEAFAATFMPDEESVRIWNPYNDYKSDFIVNCHVTPYNFLFFYNLYAERKESRFHSRRYHKSFFYSVYDEEDDIHEGIFEIMRNVLAEVIENYFTTGLERLYNEQLKSYCEKKKIPASDCDKRIPNKIKEKIYYSCLNRFAERNWNLILKRHFDKIYTSVIHSVWENYKHLLKDENFIDTVNDEIESKYDNLEHKFTGTTLEWIEIPSIGIENDNNKSLNDLIKGIKWHYHAAMENYHKIIQQVHKDYIDELKEYYEEDIDTEPGDYYQELEKIQRFEKLTEKFPNEFLSNCSYIVIFEPTELNEPFKYLSKLSPFPWFMTNLGDKKLRYRHYDPKVIDGKTFLYLVPIEYVT